MVFSSSLFLFLFLPIFLVLYFGIPNTRTRMTIPWRNTVLFVGSVLFYAWGESIYIGLILLSILANYFLAIRIEGTKQSSERPGRISKIWLIGAVSFNLFILGIFKYTGFFAENIAALLDIPAPQWQIPLPIGISFYTFHILSYLIDIYWGNVKVQKNPFYLGAYIVAFPQLVAGPVVRYKTIERELHHRKETINEFAAGARRFMIGLGKKVLIANNVAFVADAIFARSPVEYGAIGAWAGIICYTLQIYFDFSGYSDMAIGLGRMLGFHYLENFRYPYISKSITEFWRRWHISLSSFFRDYVYIPLGGNRVKRGRFILNILIVWSLTGLWHGSSWNFVLWGTYYGLLLLGEKLIWGSRLRKLPAFIRHIYTMLAVIIGWAIFRMDGIAEAGSLIFAMFGAYGTGDVDFLSMIAVLQGKYIIAMIAGVIFSVPTLAILDKKVDLSRLGLLIDLALIVIFLASIMNVLAGGFNPFIYFRF